MIIVSLTVDDKIYDRSIIDNIPNFLDLITRMSTFVIFDINNKLDNMKIILKHITLEGPDCTLKEEIKSFIKINTLEEAP